MQDYIAPWQDYGNSGTTSFTFDTLGLKSIGFCMVDPKTMFEIGTQSVSEVTTLKLVYLGFQTFPSYTLVQEQIERSSQNTDWGQFGSLTKCDNVPYLADRKVNGF